MDNLRSDDQCQDSTSPAPLERGTATERQLAQIQLLLKELESNQAAEAPVENKLTRAQENRLIQVRLGIAGALYASLEAKHPPTAKHCLRVALGCSAWSEQIGLGEENRDLLELAALLHDIGKIGVPDAVLLKPGALSPQEISIIDSHWHHGQSILRSCCANQEVLDIVRYAHVWFDGSRGYTDRKGEALPMGSRMLAIIDAFDAMQSDQVYRAAMPLERAFNELLRGAGSQFDPSLVVLFIKLFEAGHFELRDEVARRWLQELNVEMAHATWKRTESHHYASKADTAESLFQQKLLDNMHDAVVFVDNTGRITLWNRGAERMTGIPSKGILQRTFLPSVIRMRTDQGKLIKDDECPVAMAIQSGVQWMKRFIIKGRSGNEMAVDGHAMPVVGNDGTVLGITLLLHDASSQITLEQRCQNLHEIATRDPLTQVANRAEFDRVLSLFVDAHKQSKLPCSLLICDIDRFKRINDTFGHQAGDAIIQSFAKVLQNAARPGDLVARYGGEEFVVLCADCDNASIASRGEELRSMFAELRQPALNSQCVTASFGVTEIQPGDTAETMLRRADRALLLAKETGRNKVVQLGIGSDSPDEGAADQGRSSRGDTLMVQEMITQSPMDRTVDKLRGFIADHHGELVSIDGRSLQVKLGESAGLFFRRNSDRTIPVILDMTFAEDVPEQTETGRSQIVRTRIRVEVRPQRSRDRRQADACQRVKQLLISLRAYLMAIDVAPRVEAETMEDKPFEAESTGWFGGLFGKRKPATNDGR